METEALIARLAGETRPVPRGAVRARIIRGALAGGAFVLVVALALFGLRPDLPSAIGTASFWIKFGYAAAIGLIAVANLPLLGRPERDRKPRLWPLLVPVGIVAALAIAELALAPAGARHRMMMGGTWRVCPWLIVALAVPIYASLALGVRRLAPTRLRLTGAMLGMAAGGIAATLYSLHCPEATMSFLFIWYSAGMLAATLLGALVGPRLLRW